MNDPRWFAIWTRSRHEQMVREQLERKGYQAFLPTIPKWSRWKDRKKKIDWPLFPGYCFAKFKASFTGRIIGKMFSISIYYLIFKLFGNWKNIRIKITYSKIVNAFAFANALPDFTTQLHDFRTDQCTGKI